MGWTSSTTTSTTSGGVFGGSDAIFFFTFGQRYQPPPLPATKPAIHPCAVLGVPCDVSLGQVTSAYRRLAKEHHPDLGTEQDREARTKRMAEINHAYELLRAALSRER